jgi:[protein-PII] uridylyltransferase
VNRKVLYVACLLHDIGKGRKEDHSIVGARIARTVCPRLGLKPAECDTVEWLVRYHLLMSDMAQKRDISDPRTVRDFAKAVKTRERLDLLTVLTVCDIRGVGPNTWNNWKATLLRGLFRATATALERGWRTSTAKSGGRGQEGAARGAQRLAQGRRQSRDRRVITGPTGRASTWPRRWSSPRCCAIWIPTRSASTPARTTDRDATRVCFALADHPGIFSRLAGALSAVGANVVDARTTPPRTASPPPSSGSRTPRATPTRPRACRACAHDRQDAQGRGRGLRGAGRARQDQETRTAFDVPTHITFDNEGSEIYTIIEVDTRDRPGLLYDLTKTLAAANVYIAHAVIATYGAQVVDVFYVKDMFGLKLHTRSRQQSLERKLRDAIAAWPNGLGREPMALTRPLHRCRTSSPRRWTPKGLRAAYDARPPYQRNDYLGWINRAKQDDTRQKRLRNRCWRSFGQARAT